MAAVGQRLPGGGLFGACGEKETDCAQLASDGTASRLSIGGPTGACGLRLFSPPPIPHSIEPRHHLSSPSPTPFHPDQLMCFLALTGP